MIAKIVADPRHRGIGARTGHADAVVGVRDGDVDDGETDGCQDHRGEREDPESPA